MPVSLQPPAEQLVLETCSRGSEMFCSNSLLAPLGPQCFMVRSAHCLPGAACCLHLLPWVTTLENRAASCRNGVRTASLRLCSSLPLGWGIRMGDQL